MQQNGSKNSVWARLHMQSAQLFRPREVLLRSDGHVRLIRISSFVQKCFAVLLVGVFAAGVGASGAYRAALVEIETRGNDVARLQDDHRARLEELGDALVRATERGRAEAAEAVASLIEQRNQLSARMVEIERGLAAAEGERERAIATHTGLMERLQQVEARLGSRPSDVVSAGDRAAALERLRIEAMAERGRLAVETRRLAMEHRTAAGSLNGMRAASQDAAKAQDAALAEIVGGTRSQIDEIMRILRGTGLQPDRVLATRSANAGGPFVGAVADETLPRASLQLASLGSDLERLRDLQSVLRRLPVHAPLDDFAIMSPFGMRRDPFNGQLAMHSGIDLQAPSRTPVLATAPGRVVTAAWVGEYGNMVEIQHDFGLSTRYGHLTRIDVRVGQRLERRQTVGLLGSTGRSTGPHVHYEVIVDGRAVDPIRFLEAARHVRKIQ
jgi:murein DD-endopeptidase MepM/ murein hydrolase activator NlpD